MAEILEFVIEGRDEFTHVFEKILHKIPLIGAAAAGAVAGIAGLNVAILKLTEKTAEAGEHIYNMSQRLGLSTEFVQQMSTAARMADVPIEMLEKGLGRLSLNISEATYKMGPAKDAFRELGVELFTASGRMKSAENIYPEVADAIAKIGSASRQAELAGALFGNRSLEMLQVLKKGSAAFEEARAAAEKYGTTLDQHAIANSLKFTETMKEASMALTGIRNVIAEKVMPIITGLIMKLNDFLASNRGGIGEWAERIVRSLFYLYEVGRRVFAFLEGALSKIFGGKESFDLFVSNAMTALGAVLQMMPAWGELLIVSMVTSFKLIWSSFVELGKWAWKNIFGEGATMGELIYDQLVPEFKKSMEEMGKNWGKFTEDVQPFFETLKKSISNIAGEDVFSSLNDAVDKMINGLKRIGEAHKEETNKIEKQEIDLWERVRAIWNDWFGTWTTMMQDMQSLSKWLWSSFSKGVGDAIANAIVYGKNLRESFREIGRQMVAYMISALIQIGIKQIAAAMISKVISSGEAATKLAAYAAETYASVYSANAGIPYIGPVYAAAEASGAVAAMLAGAEASAAMGTAAGGAIGGASSLAGALHGGMTSVPREETYLLQQGERVLSPDQNTDLTSFLQGSGRGAGGAIVIQKIEVNSPLTRGNWDHVMEKEMVPALNRAIKRNVFIEGISGR